MPEDPELFLGGISLYFSVVASSVSCFSSVSIASFVLWASLSVDSTVELFPFVTPFFCVAGAIPIIIILNGYGPHLGIPRRVGAGLASRTGLGLAAQVRRWLKMSQGQALLLPCVFSLARVSALIADCQQSMGSAAQALTVSAVAIRVSLTRLMLALLSLSASRVLSSSTTLTESPISLIISVMPANMTGSLAVHRRSPTAACCSRCRRSRSARSFPATATCGMARPLLV